MKRSIAGDFFSPAGYFFLGWILSYVIIGVFISFREQKKNSASFSPNEALKYCFPKRSFWGPSAKFDYKIFTFSHYLVLYPIGLFLIAGQDKLAAKIAPHVEKGLSILGVFHIPVFNGFYLDLIFTVLVLIAADFGWTVQHILFHRVRYLWEFHKVHHSATELNIFTIARLHPVDTLSQGWFAGVSIGVFLGLCKFLLGYTPSLVLFMNVSLAMALFRIFGIFRHSHVWISFSPSLSRIFCSPAMHQIHHSMEEKHHDKNFSTVFSFWDVVFGTIYVPKEKESLHFGIQAGNLEYRKYDSLFEGLVHPFFSDKILSRYYFRMKKTK